MNYPIQRLRKAILTETGIGTDFLVMLSASISLALLPSTAIAAFAGAR